MKIQSDSELQAALREIEAGVEPKPGTAEAARFHEIAKAIEDYETSSWLSFPGPKLPDW